MSLLTASHRRRVRAILVADPGLETAAIVIRVGCNERLVQAARRELQIEGPRCAIGACGTQSGRRRCSPR